MSSFRFFFCMDGGGWGVWRIVFFFGKGFRLSRAGVRVVGGFSSFYVRVVVIGRFLVFFSCFVW